MFFEYKATWWNDMSNQEEEEHGILWADGYCTAAEKVYKAFKRDLISMYLQEWDMENLLTIDDIKEGFGLT
jgi:hypothetical protein